MNITTEAQRHGFIYRLQALCTKKVYRTNNKPRRHRDTVLYIDCKLCVQKKCTEQTINHGGTVLLCDARFKDVIIKCRNSWSK